MKVYWLSRGDSGVKYFFRTRKSEIEDEVNSRNEPPTGIHKDIEEGVIAEIRKDDPTYKHVVIPWTYIEEDIDDNIIGLCWNEYPSGQTPQTIATRSECSVGSVRKMRSGTRFNDEDDGCCGTCPYFISPDEIDNMRNSHFECRRGEE